MFHPPQLALLISTSLLLGAAGAHGQATSFGSACAGGSALEPTLSAFGFPVAGKSMSLLVTGPPNAPATLIVGKSNTNWLGVPLPFDLSPLGVGGCDLNVSVHLQFDLTLNPQGFAAFSVPAKLDPGTLLFVQAFVFDPGPTTFGGLSDGLRLRFLPQPGNLGGELVITEIMKDPDSVNEAYGEWIELANLSPQAIDIEYYTLSDVADGESVMLDNGGNGIVVPSGFGITIGNSADLLLNGGVAHAATYDGASFRLENDRDEVVLTDYCGVELDRVEYDHSLGWPDQKGSSMSLRIASTSHALNDSPLSWSASTCPMGGVPYNVDHGTPLLLNSLCLVGPPPTPSGEVIFSEVFFDAKVVTDVAGEWLELHNTTGSAVDLQGWTLYWGGGEVVSHPVVVPSGGAVLLARNGNPIQNGGLPAVDYVWSPPLFLGNGEEVIQLWDDSQNLVAWLNYDNGVSFPDPEGASIALDPTKLTAGDALLGANWCQALSPYGAGDLGTPAAPNPSCGGPGSANPGDVIVTEIMKNPDVVPGELGEWFELYNTTSAPIDLEGWTIRDDGTDVHAIQAGGLGVTIAAHGYLVLGLNDDFFSNGGVVVHHEYSPAWRLGNADDEIVLLDDGLNEIDRVEYDDGLLWPDDGGRSLSLRAGVLSGSLNDFGTNWCSASSLIPGSLDSATPGASNDGCP